MAMPLRISTVMAGALVLAVGAARGQTTRPTTRPLGPTDTLLAVEAARVTGDAATVREILLARTAADRSWVDAVADQAVATAEYRRAVADRFGRPAAEAALPQPRTTAASDDPQEVILERVDGDVAHVGTPASFGGCPLHRVDGRWRILVSEVADRQSAAEVDRYNQTFRRSAGRLRQFAAKVRAGEFASATAAQAALDRASREDDDEPHPATRPAASR